MFVPRTTRRVTAGIGVVSLFVVATVFAQQADWHPSRWGPDDQRGSANFLTPSKVLEARGLITTGQVYELGRAYEAEMPLFMEQDYTLRLRDTAGPMGTNQATVHMADVEGRLGQVGTNVDGLGHIGVGDTYYNGHSAHDIATPNGLTKLGIQQVGPIVTRGVLIDIAGYKGVEMLAGGYEITGSDLRLSLERQGVAVRTGDVVLIHTGWGALWKRDNERFSASEPGIGLEAARFLVESDVVAVGSDTWAIEVVPNPEPSLMFPVHQELITRNGTYVIENVATEALAADRVYEFAFMFVPLPLKGSAGAPGSPIAIR